MTSTADRVLLVEVALRSAYQAGCLAAVELCEAGVTLAAMLDDEERAAAPSAPDTIPARSFPSEHVGQGQGHAETDPVDDATENPAYR